MDKFAAINRLMDYSFFFNKIKNKTILKMLKPPKKQQDYNVYAQN